jgi:hypothetical protein
MLSNKKEYFYAIKYYVEMQEHYFVLKRPSVSILILEVVNSSAESDTTVKTG